MRPIALLLLVALGLVVGAPPVTGSSRPARFVIAGVPEVSQVDYSGCGAAALAMLFGHQGPAVDYMEIVDVVRSMAHGTSLPDMVRGGHFSEASAAASEAYPACRPLHGYPSRKLGYGAFFHASRTPWLDGLKDVLAQGYPVAVLTDWKPGESGPHYRVVTGYDDTEGVLYLQDPWPYGDSLDGYRRPGLKGWAWPQADFLAVWSLSTEEWGLPGGYRYGAVLAAPWKVQVHLPGSVGPGEAFTVEARAEYACPAPFGTTFPRFPARDLQFELRLPPALAAAGPRVRPADPSTLRAGETTPPVAFQVLASSDAAGHAEVTVTARGRVTGQVPRWGDTSWSPAYEYTDVIGGQATATTRVR